MLGTADTPQNHRRRRRLTLPLISGPGSSSQPLLFSRPVPASLCYLAATAAALLLAVTVLSTRRGLGPRLVWPEARATSVLPPLTRGGAAEHVMQRWTAFSACLNLTPCSSRRVAHAPPPFAVAEAHFRELYAASAPFRDLTTHAYAGYSGPWIENVWVSLDAAAVFEAFYPVIPLFLQSTDICVVHPELKPAAAAFLRGRLRPEFIYAVVSQHDRGLCILEPPPGTEPIVADPCGDGALADRLLHFSAGGYGNVPIPLIKGDAAIGRAPPPPEEPAAHGVAFAASLETHPRGFRAAVHGRLVEMERALGLPFRSLYFFYYKFGGDWEAVVRSALLAAAPRGYGRSSFRSSELVQLGIPQLVVWDDEPWLPYRHPDPAVRAQRQPLWGPGGVGLEMNFSGLDRLPGLLCELLRKEDEKEETPPAATGGAAALLAAAAAVAPPVCSGSALSLLPPYTVPPTSAIAAMRARTRAVAASHFTYQGLLERIAEFARDPPRADLACVRWPASRVGFQWK